MTSARPASKKPQAPKKSVLTRKTSAPAGKQAVARKPKAKAHVVSFTPREIPQRKLGKPSDPRLAAALAARERWLGRSGRPALKSGTQAVAFIRERRLVHPVTLSALPNLLDPVNGKIHTPEERSNGAQLPIVAGWLREVAIATDLVEARLCFEQPTWIQAELWPSVATIAAPFEREARKGKLVSDEARDVLEILDRKGSVSVDRLRQLTGLGAREFAATQTELESKLLVLTRDALDDEDRPIRVLEPFGDWSDRVVLQRRPPPEQAWTVLFAAAVHASVVMWPEEIATIFPWTDRERHHATMTALETGAVVTYEEAGERAFVASPVPR